MILCDTAAERAVLAGICKYGNDAYLDIADLIQETTFTVDSNAIIFKCVKSIYEQENKPPRIINRKCVECYCCHEICPNQAINLNESWGVKIGRFLGERRIKRGSYEKNSCCNRNF